MLKFIAFFVPCFTFAQPTIKDMIAKDSLLYAVTTDGKIKCWNLSTEKKKTVTHNSRFTFTAISSDKQQNVVVGTNDGKLFTLSDKGLQLLHAMQKPYTIEHIVFNSQNEPYLIICNALYAPLTHTYWTAFPQQTTVGIRIEKRAKEFFRFPSCVFVDAHDVIWMTNFYGEFGGSFQLFDSKERKPLNRSIENLELGLFFPQSIFSDGKTDAVYIASGLQHLINSGDIFKIDNYTAEKILNDDDFDLNNRLFIGASTIDPVTQTLYIATQKGIYKTFLSESRKIGILELLCEPKLRWEREPLAMGAKMAIKKLLLVRGKLLFLTSQNGIGVFENGNISYLK
ncbi:hypothetical protein [Capnocytophaga ochracea]|jgi:hypothetical protein|uniref:hypothetical protein n=1 Tax=Capnocytophaga ochracea TaxID=1018 RepID=UPI00222FF7C0|nr:hypothetical protein [Capnocytophaga ochracea]UZD36752.1 hypothetical protein OLG90_02390 [Capnocytophaga ochracea]